MTCCFVCVFTMVVICLVCLGCFGRIRWPCEFSDIIIVVDEEVECMQYIGRYAVGIGNEHEGVCD